MTKQHANTLYVTTQGAHLSAEGETAVVRVDREVVLRVPLHNIEGIVCFGRVSCTPQLMGRCAERDVAVSFLTERGRYIARVQGPISGNVLLRREQYRRADDDDLIVTLARAFVSAKIANCRRIAQRARRDHFRKEDGGELEAALNDMVQNLRTLQTSTSVNSIRGIEGDAARTYFSIFDCFITRQEDEFRFGRRSRRPPLDRINALLSFLYTLLVRDVSSALEAVGLDPQVGFLHRDRPGRPGLALDIMEELRPVLGDRVALSVINRRQVRSQGFEISATGGVYMDDQTRKTVLVAYQERKQEELIHPFLGERVTLGMVVHLQARLLARYLRGDLDGYPPFFWK